MDKLLTILKIIGQNLTNSNLTTYLIDLDMLDSKKQL